MGAVWTPIAEQQSHMFEQSGYPVQLQHVLLPHVALQPIYVLLGFQKLNCTVACPNG